MRNSKVATNSSTGISSRSSVANKNAFSFETFVVFNLSRFGRSVLGIKFLLVHTQNGAIILVVVSLFAKFYTSLQVFQ